MNNNDNNSSSCESGKAVKRIPEGDDTATDRLSHLPDFIIHHILSFLETKWAVQTSVLSRSWRSAWKHVPVINLHSLRFREPSSFRRFVDNVLSLRHPFKVHEMIFILYHRYNGEEDDEEEDVRFIAKVAEYALSHGTQHLVFELTGVWSYQKEDICKFSNLFGTISNCDLKTLVLAGVCIDSGFGYSRFQTLTTLDLAGCWLASYQNGACDPFSNCPSLENLVLNGCRHLDRNFFGDESVLKIFGPQLLSLYMDNVLWNSDVEIFAPRLKYFDLHSGLNALSLSKLTLSSLDRAFIRIYEDYGIYDEAYFMEGNEESVIRLLALFQGLSNVTTLRLEPGTIKALSRINPEFLDLQSSPFTRLKTLTVNADKLPYLPLTYFLEGSSVAEPTIEFVYRDRRYCPFIIVSAYPT